MLMIAKLGALAVSASALIFTATTTLLLMVWAMLYSVAVIVGRLYGENKFEEIGKVVTAGLLIALFSGSIFACLLWHIDALLFLLQQPRDLVVYATPYFHIFSLGIIPSICMVCCNEFAMGIGRSRLVIIWDLCALPLNISLSYCLLFGKFGFPQLGITGAAYATTITYWTLICCALGYLKFSKKYRIFNVLGFNREKIKFFCVKILRIGWPISLQLGASSLSYCFLTCMMGWLGKPSLAAYHIVNQLTTLIIMVPYGMAQATGVLVAQAIGEKRRDIIDLGYVGIFLSLTIVGIMSLLYWVIPHTLISVYIDIHNATNNHIVYLTTILLAVMGVIQLTDVVGVVSTGALRGFHDTTIPMFIGASMHWLCSIPLGYYLAFIAQWGAVGIFTGFFLGSLCSAILLICRLKVLGKSINLEKPW